MRMCQCQCRGVHKGNDAFGNMFKNSEKSSTMAETNLIKLPCFDSSFFSSLRNDSFFRYLHLQAFYIISTAEIRLFSRIRRKTHNNEKQEQQQQYQQKHTTNCCERRRKNLNIFSNRVIFSPSFFHALHEMTAFRFSLLKHFFRDSAVAMASIP